MFKKIIWLLALLCLMLVSFSFSQVPVVDGRIVFVSDRDGYQNLWVFDLETWVMSRLTNFPEDLYIEKISYPRWSPDGKKVAFIGLLGDVPYYPASSELFIINDDGTNLRQITFYETTQFYARFPAWDPNRTDIIYISKAWPATKSIVYRLNIDTLEETEIPSFTANFTRLCDISSNGDEYLFLRGTVNWPANYMGYQDLSGTYQNIIKPRDDNAERFARINREDGWIIYADSIGASYKTNIYKMDEDGNFNTQLTFGIGGEGNLNPAWVGSNNEGYIVFDTNKDGNRDIVLMKALVGEYPDGLIKVTDGPSYDGYPDWTSFGFYREVAIDIKPGSYPNSINLGSNGNVPVAIFSTETFDATTVDPLSITLAGAEVRIRGKGDSSRYYQDVDGDGLLDVLVHVDTQTFTLTGTDTEAILEGETFDGQKIRGVDTIRIVN